MENALLLGPTDSVIYTVDKKLLMESIINMDFTKDFRERMQDKKYHSGSRHECPSETKSKESDNTSD